MAVSADGFRVFPGALSEEFGSVLGAAEFKENVGSLLQESTMETYAPKIMDWYEYNRVGNFNPAEVVDAKVCAFAGWLGWGRGSKSTRDKALNGWTSALNGHFDAKYQTRPFNTHFVRRLKQRYHDAQFKRTMALLPADALEPKEARIGLPASGLGILIWKIGFASGKELYRLLLLMAIALFLVRPATVWAFEPGDYDIMATPAGGLFIVCISRSVKRHPEYMISPNRREIEVPLVMGHPLAVIAFGLFRARRCSPTWATQLRVEQGQQKHGAARMSAWLRAACPPKQLALPAGRRISAYSLRIAGVSAMRLVLHVEPEFVRRWGLWSSFAMVDTYTRFDYGPGAVLAQLWGWASSQQWRGTEVLAQGAAASGATAALLRLAQHGDTTAPTAAAPATTTRRVVLMPPADGYSPAAAARYGRRRRLLRGR